MDEMVSTLTGTLPLNSDEEDALADPSGFTRSAASATSMRIGGSHWVEGAPTQSQGRSKGAHLRLTLPAGTTKVSVKSHISCSHLFHNSCSIP